MDINSALKCAAGIAIAAKVVPSVVDAGVDVLQEAVQTPMKIVDSLAEETLGKIIDIAV